jgi:perosamine synthetase
MFSVVVGRGANVDRDALMALMHERGIETRPVFYPIHLLPPYREAARGEEFPVAEWLARRGVSLPTWAGLSPEDLGYICETLCECLSDGRGARPALSRASGRE